MKKVPVGNGCCAHLVWRLTMVDGVERLYRATRGLVPNRNTEVLASAISRCVSLDGPYVCEALAKKKRADTDM